MDKECYIFRIVLTHKELQSGVLKDTFQLKIKSQIESEKLQQNATNVKLYANTSRL